MVKQWAVLLGIPALCIAFLINRRSIWLDEATSIYIASKSIAGMLATLRHIDAVFAFYYFILHFWMMFGESAVAVRMLSVIFAIATLPVFYAIARRLYSSEAAFLATFTLGTSFMFLHYAVETRSYALELFFCALAALYFLKLLDEPLPRNAAAYAAFSLAAIYAHPLAILWLAAQAASLLALRPQHRIWRRLASCWAAVAVGLLPLAAAVRLNGTGQIDWIAPISRAAFASSLNQLLGGLDGGPFHHAELTGICALLVAAGTFAGLHSSYRRVTAMLLIWFLLPLVLMGIISIAKPIEQIYYFRYALIPVFLLIGAGLDWIRLRAGFAAVCVPAALVVAGGISQAFLYAGEDWRGVAAYMQARTTTGDALIAYTPPVIRPLDYAQRERGLPPAAHLVYPASLDSFGIQLPPPKLLLQTSWQYPRLWLVLSHRKSYWEKFLGPLRHYYSTVSVTDFTLIEVRELRRRLKR